MSTEVIGRIRISYRGEYDSGANYSLMDRVFYQGATYECTENCSGIDPSNTSNWIRITGEKGDAGSIDTLPTATKTSAGIVRIGDGIDVSNGVISVTNSGTGTGGGSSEVQIASKTSPGIVQIGSGIDITPEGVISVASSGEGGSGIDGISPVATVVKNNNVATISITDKNGTTTAEVKDGSTPTLTFADPTTLAAGSKATVDVTKTGDNYTITLGIPQGESGSGSGTGEGSSGNSDGTVIQTATATAGEYPLLFKNTTATTTVTDSVRFGASITVNPSSSVITCGGIKTKAADTALTPANAVGSFTISGATLTPKSVNGANLTAVTLPSATASALGLVKIGTNINVSSGTISVPTASATAQGVVRIGSGLELASNGSISVPEMEGSSQNSKGAAGLVPAPPIRSADDAKNGRYRVLFEDGTWDFVDIWYNLGTKVSEIPYATSSVYGLVKTGTNITNTSGVISVPVATASAAGVVSTSEQTFAGKKNFAERITLNSHRYTHGTTTTNYKPQHYNMLAFRDVNAKVVGTVSYGLWNSKATGLVLRVNSYSGGGLGEDDEGDTTSLNIMSHPTYGAYATAPTITDACASAVGTSIVNTARLKTVLADYVSADKAIGSLTISGATITPKSISGTNMTAVTIPNASNTAAGVMSTGSQAFAGTKTLYGSWYLREDTYVRGGKSTSNPLLSRRYDIQDSKGTSVQQICFGYSSDSSVHCDISLLKPSGSGTAYADYIHSGLSVDTSGQGWFRVPTAPSTATSVEAVNAAWFYGRTATASAAGIVSAAAQSFKGAKTFTANTFISASSPVLVLQDTSATKGATSAATTGTISFCGSSGTAVKDRVGALSTLIPSGGGSQIGLMAYKPTAGNTTYYGMYFLYPTTGTCSLTVGANILPRTNKSNSLGLSAQMWSTIYANTSSISSSDERLKDEIDEIPEEVFDAWAEVNFCQYKFKDSIEEKGADKARLHVGAIAQRIKEVFEKHELDPTRYGLFCYDEWEDKYEEVSVIDKEAVYEERKVIDSPEVREVHRKSMSESDNDNEDVEEEEIIVSPEISHMENVLVEPEVSHIEKTKTVEAGNQYSLRYEELLTMEAAYQRHRADKLEARLAALEEKLKDL